MIRIMMMMMLLENDDNYEDWDDNDYGYILENSSDKCLLLAWPSEKLKI